MRFFVQVTYNDLRKYLLPILFFRINCEIYMSYDLIDYYKEKDLVKMASILKRYKIDIRMHAPLGDPYDAGFDVFEDIYKKSMRVCRALGIRSLIMHLEYNRVRCPSLKEWFYDAKGPWEWIAQSSSEDEVEVLIENHEEATAEPIVRMIKHLNSPNIGACYDVGHYNAFGDKAIKNHLDSYEDVAIREAHLSDNMGDRDAHLALGKGNIDFPAFFAAMDARALNPVCTIEAKGLFGVIGGIRYLKRIKRI